jgi:hypothetical protein
MRALNEILRKCVLPLIIMAGIMTEAKAVSEDELIDGYSHAYNASGKLSKGDFRMLVKLELLQADWNNTLASLPEAL